MAENEKGSIYYLNTGAWTGIQTWAGKEKGNQVTLVKGDTISLSPAEYKELRPGLAASLVLAAEWAKLEKQAARAGRPIAAPNKGADE